jgi:DNA polymerase III epsilon subunit-like protein
MRNHWNDTPIHVIDFEGSRATGVLEYGVATLHHGTIASAKTRICSPIGKIPEAETRVHGIGHADTVGKMPFSDEREFFMDLRSSGPLCAHNASFEKHLLKAVWPYPRTSPDFINPGKNVTDWGPWVDTLRLYEIVFPTLADYSLGALLTTFGLAGRLDIMSIDFCPPSRRHFHCALYDALGSALLLEHLGRLPGYEELTLEWLMIHSQTSSENVEQTEIF